MISISLYEIRAVVGDLFAIEDDLDDDLASKLDL